MVRVDATSTSEQAESGCFAYGGRMGSLLAEVVPLALTAAISSASST
jgi:hypothetical protein